MDQIPQRSPAELAAQKKRNIWLALALLAFVGLIGVTAAIRIKQVDFSKSDGFYFDGSMSEEAAPSNFDDESDGEEGE